MWIERDLTLKLKEVAGSRPVLLLTGARQSGKSSLLSKCFNEKQYISFDSLLYVEAAEENPVSFLSGLKDGAILDEIQYVPSLFRELKQFVDKNRTSYGRWLLTGSQRFELMNGISESLAGRIGILNLETLSAKELRDAPIENLDHFLWKGGYPELWVNPKISVDEYFQSYLRSYIERDLRSLIEIKKLADFQKLLRVLATRVGQLVNYKDLSNDTDISDVTVKKWVLALEASGLVYLLPPFYANIGKRLTKSSKIYFADHGLLCHLLGVESNEEFLKSGFKGNIWENICMMELIKTQYCRPGIDLFFYRDQNGVEIDFIIQRKSGMYFMEAKSSERVDSKKLNFKKVVPLFKKEKIHCLLFNCMNEKSTLQFKDFDALNPVKCEIKLKKF